MNPFLLVEEILPEPPKWHEQAACANEPPELFFPLPGRGHAQPGLAICKTCPVMAECQADALLSDNQYGIWGGLSQDELQARGRADRARTRAAHKGELSA